MRAFKTRKTEHGGGSELTDRELLAFDYVRATYGGISGKSSYIRNP
jgi:hypothetical protein